MVNRLYGIRNGRASYSASPTSPSSTAFFPTAYTKGLNVSGNFLASLIFFHSISDTGYKTSGTDPCHGKGEYSQLWLRLLKSIKTGRISSGNRAKASSCGTMEVNLNHMCRKHGTYHSKRWADRSCERRRRTCGQMSMMCCCQSAIYLPTTPDDGSAITATSGLLCLAIPFAFDWVELESLNVEAAADL